MDYTTVPGGAPDPPRQPRITLPSLSVALTAPLPSPFPHTPSGPQNPLLRRLSLDAQHNMPLPPLSSLAPLTPITPHAQLPPLASVAAPQNLLSVREPGSKRLRMSPPVAESTKPQLTRGQEIKFRSPDELRRFLGSHKFSLDVIQQPKQCKITSTVDKGGLSGRRTIVPPPVVKLVLRRQRPGNSTELSTDEEISSLPNWILLGNFLVTARCRRLSDGKPSGPASKPAGKTGDGRPRRGEKSKQLGNRGVSDAGSPLIGVRVSSCYKIQRNGNLELIFVFGDLSMLSLGTFRLEFDLVEIRNGRAIHRTSTLSDPFQVYAAKRYPGSFPSTSLIRLISNQGVRVRLRKETLKKGGYDRTAAPGAEGGLEEKEQSDITRQAIERERNGFVPVLPVANPQPPAYILESRPGYPGYFVHPSGPSGGPIGQLPGPNRAQFLPPLRVKAEMADISWTRVDQQAGQYRVHKF